MNGKMQFSLFSLMLLLLLAASITLNVIHLAPTKETQSSFPPIDGSQYKARYIDVGKFDGVLVRFGTIYDSGAEIERVIRGRTLWRVLMAPLGVGHSEYSHDVDLKIVQTPTASKLQIISNGSYGTVVETRSLTDGKLLERTDSFFEYRMKPGYPPDWSNIHGHLDNWERCLPEFEAGSPFTFSSNKLADVEEEVFFQISQKPPPEFSAPAQDGKYFIVPGRKWVNSIDDAVVEWRKCCGLTENANE